MACQFDPDACRREHISPCLSDASPDGSDYEARCPICRHPTFRISEPRVRKYRHVWTCACKGQCGCTAGALRVELLKAGVMGWCLGVYNGPVEKNIPPEIARSIDLAIDDIFAVPHLKPAEIRLVLAQARGRQIPDDFTAFVRFARSLGISRTRAQEMAEQWCRPPDCRPQTRGARTDTSRSTGASEVVKQASSEPRDLTDLVNQHHQKGKDAPPVTLTETVNRANPDIQPAA